MIKRENIIIIYYAFVVVHSSKLPTENQRYLQEFHIKLFLQFHAVYYLMQYTSKLSCQYKRSLLVTMRNPLYHVGNFEEALGELTNKILFWALFSKN